jgi:hypothetical protein
MGEEVTEDRNRRATDGEAFIRRLNLSTLASLAMLVTQLGLVGWAKWTIESVVKESAQKVIDVHNHDPAAHPNLDDLILLKAQLQSIDAKVTSIRDSVIRLETKTEETERNREGRRR